MTPGEASALVRGMCRRWPYPDLDEEGRGLLAASLIATNLHADDAEDAIRHLMATRTSGFRPEPGEIAELARQRGLAARRPAAQALPPGDDNRPSTLTEALAELARVTIEARDARHRYAHRVGLNVDRLETGSMRHVSTILGIGRTVITGRDPQATELATELLRRHDARGAT